MRTLRGIIGAIRARPAVFGGVAAAVALLNVALPVAVLTVTRKPWDYFAFNAWLPQLPGYLVSAAPLDRKLAFLWDLALCWFIADGAYGAPEWGFAVTVADVVRIAAVSLLFGAYFALRAGGRGPVVAGAAASVAGLSTGPCSVMGCGAPVIPVVGLAFGGLSSGTLAAMAAVSRWATLALLVALAAAVLYLGSKTGSGLAFVEPADGKRKT